MACPHLDSNYSESMNILKQVSYLFPKFKKFIKALLKRNHTLSKTLWGFPIRTFIDESFQWNDCALRGLMLWKNGL